MMFAASRLVGVLLLTIALVGCSHRLSHSAYTTVSAASGAWILGEKGQTCSEVCDAKPGVVCANAALIQRNTEVDSADKASSVFSSAGQKCDKSAAETDFDQASAPYLIDYGMFGIDCTFTTSPTGDCAASPRRSDERRLCWCEPGDGPSPTKAPVKECTWNVDCKPIDCNGAHDMCLRVQSPSEGNSGCRLNHGLTYGTCQWGGVEEGACCYMG